MRINETNQEIGGLENQQLMIVFGDEDPADSVGRREGVAVCVNCFRVSL